MSEPCGQKQGADECEHIGLPDTHAHLSYVVERAGSDFLDKLSSRYNKPNAFVLDPGVDFDDFPTRKKMLGGLPFVRLAAGIWPDSSSMSRVDERVAVLEDFVRDSACRAVGECGLDYHWMHGSVEEQAALFAAQIHLAVRYSKPLIVHSRNAHADTLSHVRNVAAKIPVVIHCFGYDADSANEYLAAGCYVSFAGNITYKKSGNLRAACATVPDDRLLLETDSPYMNPEPMRGKDSSPLDIGRTYKTVAALRGCDVETVSSLVYRNARVVFDQ